MLVLSFLVQIFFIGHQLKTGAAAFTFFRGKLSHHFEFNSMFLSGSLIKLVYFSRHAEHSTDNKRKVSIKRRLGMFNGGRRSFPILGGRLHFVKFETGKLNECLDFISSKQLHRGGMLALN
jgi:hypothetical protein